MLAGEWFVIEVRLINERRWGFISGTFMMTVSVTATILISLGDKIMWLCLEILKGEPAK